MLTLILGGARSGKSRYAQSLCAGTFAIYVATAKVADDDIEMAHRIARHRGDRPSQWRTIEEPLRVVEVVRKLASDALVIVDCVTVWISNLQEQYASRSSEERETAILAAVADFVEATRGRDVIVVTNDVGSGIVPMHPVAREFRDLQGLANQFLAGQADAVALLVAGLPVVLKGSAPQRFGA